MRRCSASDGSPICMRPAWPERGPIVGRRDADRERRLDLLWAATLGASACLFGSPASVVRLVQCGPICGGSGAQPHGEERRKLEASISQCSASSREGALMSAQALFPQQRRGRPTTLWRLNELSGAEFAGRFQNSWTPTTDSAGTLSLVRQYDARSPVRPMQHGCAPMGIVKVNDLQGLCVLFRIAWRDNDTPGGGSSLRRACLSSGATVPFEDTLRRCSPPRS